MTREELKNDFGSLINQVDNSGEFVTSFVTDTEAEKWLNDYYQEVYKWYATANRDRFTTTAYANTVTDQSIYTFGGDAVDLLAIAWVGLKYSNNDTDYRRVEKMNKADYYDTGYEKATKTSPIYFEKQIYNTSSGHYELGVEFPEACIPEESITKGLKVMYIERPARMEEDTDIPEKLPEELHKYISMGAAVKGFMKMGEFAKAEDLTAWFDGAMLGFMAQEQSLSSERTKRVKMPKRDVVNFYRYDR